jgi:NAD(P)-dependent dehydrogenase (short-subunit alcohol dehydrogenase family)
MLVPMSMDLDLTGRRVLVTGAGQGVGRGVTHGFATAGAEVVVNDFYVERAETVVEEVRRMGGTAVVSVFDVADYPAVVSGIEAVGGVDILVNNAGNAGPDGWHHHGDFVDTGPADWEPFLRVNLYGVLHCARAALPGMIAKRWGRVITVVSDAARGGERGQAAYSAAKAGAAGLTRALATETGRHGITVNNIALGTMRTPMTEALWADQDDPRARAILKGYLVRRPGLPEDVAALAVFLASPQAAWITGQTYPLNGGYSFSL